MDFRNTNPDNWKGNVDFLDIFGDFVLVAIACLWLTCLLKIKQSKYQTNLQISIA